MASSTTLPVTDPAEPQAAETLRRDGPAGAGVRRRRPGNPVVAAAFFGVAALLLFAIGIGNPAKMIFDEPYFVPEARAFATHQPVAHPIVPTLSKPPLGKFLMGIGIRAAGDTAAGWRMGGAVCGSLAVMAVYLWVYLLLKDRQLAAVAAMVTIFNNVLFVLSRTALMDAYLMFFLTWSLVSFTAAFTLEIRPLARRVLAIFAGILLGLAGSCKWNAVDTLAVFVLVSVALPLLVRRRPSAVDPSLEKWAESARQIGFAAFVAALLIAPAAAYGLTFWPLCRLLHRPFSVHELASMNALIWHFNSTTISNPSITSPWYAWPLNIHPTRALSYLVGNPVVSWGGLAALALCVRRAWKSMAIPEALVALLFASNYLQWAVTPEKGLFYYYYFPSLMFLGVAIAVAMRNVPSRIFGVRVSTLVVLLEIVIFVWCYPRMAHLGAPWDCALGCWS